MRNVLSHVPASTMAEVAEDLKAISKVRCEKTAKALSEESVEIHGERFAKAVSVFEARGSGARLRTCALSGLAPLQDTHDEVRAGEALQGGEAQDEGGGGFPERDQRSTLATEIVLRSSEEEWALKRYLRIDALKATEKPNPQHSRRWLAFFMLFPATSGSGYTVECSDCGKEMRIFGDDRVAGELETRVLGRIPLLPDASGEPGRSLFAEDTAPARAFDEIARTISQTKVRKRIKVL